MGHLFQQFETLSCVYLLKSHCITQVSDLWPSWPSCWKLSPVELTNLMTKERVQTISSITMFSVILLFNRGEICSLWILKAVCCRGVRKRICGKRLKFYQKQGGVQIIYHKTTCYVTQLLIKLHVMLPNSTLNNMLCWPTLL